MKTLMMITMLMILFGSLNAQMIFPGGNEGIFPVIEAPPLDESDVFNWISSGLSFEEYKSEYIRPISPAWMAMNWRLEYIEDIPTYCFDFQMEGYEPRDWHYVRFSKESWVPIESNYETVGQFQPKYAANPEPSTYGMIGAGVLIGLILFKRIKQRKI